LSFDKLTAQKCPFSQVFLGDSPAQSLALSGIHIKSNAIVRLRFEQRRSARFSWRRSSFNPGSDPRPGET
jgi:hypothetical protein